MKFMLALAAVAAAGVYAGTQISDDLPTAWPCTEDEVLSYAEYVEDASCVHIDQIGPGR